MEQQQTRNNYQLHTTLDKPQIGTKWIIAFLTEHTEIEVKLIKDMIRRNSNAGLQDLWIKLKKRDYTRTIQGLGKTLNRFQMSTNPKVKRSPTCEKNKPYEK